MMEIKFISTADGSRPAYGEPVLVIIKGVLQHITYTLDGFDETPDWFEPYFFDHGDDMKVLWNEVDEWAYLENDTGK